MAGSLAFYECTYCHYITNYILDTSVIQRVCEIANAEQGARSHVAVTKTTFSNDYVTVGTVG